MSDYDAVKNPLRRSTFRQPPPHPQDMGRTLSAASAVPPTEEYQLRPSNTQSIYDELRDFYQPLCNNLSTDTLMSVLRLFPADETAMQFRNTYTRLERANQTRSALALCLFCVFQALHQPPDATPLLLQKLVNALQRLEHQMDDLPGHTGSTAALYNHIYGLLAHCAVHDEVFTMQELQQIFRAYNQNDPIYLCFNDWLQRSEAVNARGNKTDKAPFWKKIWQSVRSFLDNCYHSQQPQQHVLITDMRNMTQWHATLCVYEGILATGASPYVTTEGASLLTQQNGPKLAGPPSGQQQPALAQQGLPSQPNDAVEEESHQEYRAFNHDFAQNQQDRKERAEPRDGTQSLFPDVEAQGYPDESDNIFSNRPGPAFPNDMFDMPAQPQGQLPFTGANQIPDIPGDGPPRRCVRCEEKHIRCDYKRPCGSCRKVGRGTAECVPRIYVRNPNDHPTPQPKPKPKPKIKIKPITQTLGGKPGSAVDWSLFDTEERDAGGPSAFMGGGFNSFGEVATVPDTAPYVMGNGNIGEGGAGEQNDLAAGNNFLDSFNFDMGDAVDDAKHGDYHE